MYNRRHFWLFYNPASGFEPFNTFEVGEYRDGS